VLSCSSDRGLLAPLVYGLVNNGLSQPGLPPIAASGLCHVLASCMLLHAGPNLVLNCVWLIGSYKSSKIKSDVSWRRNSTVERARWTGTAHWPADNLFKHNLCKMLFELTLFLFTSRYLGSWKSPHCVCPQNTRNFSNNFCCTVYPKKFVTYLLQIRFLGHIHF